MNNIGFNANSESYLLKTSTRFYSSWFLFHMNVSIKYEVWLKKISSPSTDDTRFVFDVSFYKQTKALKYSEESKKIF